MSERKKILILGNGFDLAHFLPTKYEHFITAMRAVEDADSNEHLLFDNIFHELLASEDFFLNRTKEMYKTEDVKISVESLILLKEKLSNNGWFQYFKDYLDSGIDTWIDFENEIKNVLDIVCSVLDKNSDKNEMIDIKYYGSDLNIIADEFFEDFNTKKNHYLNVLLKLGILRNTYIYEDEGNFIEVNKFGFDDMNQQYGYDPLTGFGRPSPAFEELSLNDDYVKKYKGKTTGVHIYKVIENMNYHLSSFIDIFSRYIELVESLVPRSKLQRPKALCNLDDIYSFNYSSTTSRLYETAHQNFLHGKAGADNIVLGISELENELLVNQKAYGFVKYYQKLVNDTNYKFLSGNQSLNILERNTRDDTNYMLAKPYEVYIWGHSLDSSDSDYIKEIFSFNKTVRVSVYLIVYYFPSPHAQLANLISIMGKDIIEMWMKKGWLEFVEAPDIYALNSTEGYVDKLSKYSEGGIFA